MSKKYSVIVVPAAYKMLFDHVEFLWQVSPSAADRLDLSYKKSLARLADNPFQFPIADELDAPNLPPDTYRKCLFEKRYKALFLVRESEVFVIAVIDARRENKELL
jgi:plasmid stabilization system protein ParE